MKVKEMICLTKEAYGEAVFYSAHNGKRIPKTLMDKVIDCDISSIWAQAKPTKFGDTKGSPILIKAEVACFVSIPNFKELGL